MPKEIKEIITVLTMTLANQKKEKQVKSTAQK